MSWQHNACHNACMLAQLGRRPPGLSSARITTDPEPAGCTAQVDEEVEDKENERKRCEMDRDDLQRKQSRMRHALHTLNESTLCDPVQAPCIIEPRQLHAKQLTAWSAKCVCKLACSSLHAST